MTVEKKARLVRALKKVGREIVFVMIPGLAVTTTIAAAWDGYVGSRRNEREIQHIDARIKDLELRNNKLLDEAMYITERQGPD